MGAGDVHCRRLHLPGEVLRAARRPGHHHRQREVQVSRGSLPAQLPGYGVLRHPRDHLQLHHEVTSISGRTCTPTLSSLEAPPCTPESPTECRRRSPPWLPQRGSTPSGLEAPSWLPSPPSSRCGSPSRSTMSPAPPSCTGSVSKKPEGGLATLPPCDLRRQSDTSCHVLAVFCLV